MRKSPIFLVAAFALLLIIGLSLFLLFKKPGPEVAQKPSKSEPTPTAASAVKLSSSAFAAGDLIPQKYTCDGQNISPPLTIAEVPAKAASLALIVDDPDAPGGTFTHWLIFNIDSKTLEIAEGTPPQGAQEGMNNFGKIGYGGPCPPAGTHRYFFKLYALDSKLDLPQNFGKGEAEKEISGHILAQTELVGRYQR